MLNVFVGLYLLVSIGIGLYAARRVQSSQDYVVAGRSLPLYITTATVFATWFGSETVLGTSSTFLQEGLHGIVADPFGASLCLILVGVFFARKLYRMNLLTIGDFFRIKYGRADAYLRRNDNANPSKTHQNSLKTPNPHQPI